MEQTISPRPQAFCSHGGRQDMVEMPARLTDHQIRLVAASAGGWAEFASLDGDTTVLGDDGLIRVAVWSASSICATLMHTRCVTLLVDEGGVAEIRCLVLAKSNLVTARPLSGFLLKPVGRIEARAGHGNASAPRQSRTRRRSDTRLALLEAFPVHQNGEEKPPGQT